MEDKSTESEEEETDYQIARIRSSEDGQVILIQMNGEGHSADDLYGTASTKDWVQYEELKSKHEDDRPAHFFQQNLTFESSSPFDIAKIFQPFPFSFYPDNGCSSIYSLLFFSLLFTQFNRNVVCGSKEKRRREFVHKRFIGFILCYRQAFRHPECIHSYASDGLLTDQENIDKGHHLNHHHHHHPRPICYVCGQPIPVDADGRPVFLQHPFWRQKYCRAHERDGTPSCCGCKRLKPGGLTYSILSDNRWLCPECRDSTVMDNHALKPLEREIREFYERLGMKIHQRNIPLLLVNQQEMKKDKARCQKNDHHRPNQTLGRTSWKPLRICTTVEGKDHILVAHSRDLTIRVWKGFPRLFTGQTLAHEMMHAWLTLEGYHDLDLVVEEGLCEILAHMWLDSHMRSMSKSKIALSPGFDFQKRLAKFLQHDIESNPDHVYGDGFRKMKRATDIYGLKGTLGFIRMTGSCP